MLGFAASSVALAFSLVANVQSAPVSGSHNTLEVTEVQARGLEWQKTLSNDTSHRLNVARQHLDDGSSDGQAFRNDTIMRVNIEREALDLPLIDLSQAFGMSLPASRDSVAGAGINKRSDAEDLREEVYMRSGAMAYPKSIQQRSNDAEDLREEVYMRSGAMAYPKSIQQRSNDAEDLREEVYMRSGAMAYPKSIQQRSNEDEDFREEVYTRGGAMAYPSSIQQRSNNAADLREEVYMRSGAMAYPKSIQQRSEAEDFREEVYTRLGAMAYPKSIQQRSTSEYGSLLNDDNLALGAVERINIAHRIVGKPEVTAEQAKEMSSHSDEYLANYWNASMRHGGFWASDQAAGKPNFVEGGQANGFGFTQTTYHKLHCLANLRTMLAWHITGNGDKMTHDMNAHTIHCLEYVRGRELISPDLNEEPIDTVDYRGMGIH